MEESEKRKERLKAMRMEAAQAEVCSNVESFVMPNSLANPLVENSASQPGQQQSYATQRFDFYTDPMSAFSANKRRTQPYNQTGHDHFRPPSYGASATAPRPSSSIPEPRNFQMAPSAAYRLQSSSPFDQRMYQTQGTYNIAGAYGSSGGTASPLPMHQGTTGTWNRLQAIPGHYNSEWNRSQATHGNRNPRGTVSSFPRIHHGTPESWHASEGMASYNSPSNSSGGGQLFSPDFRPVRSPGFSQGQGRPHWQGSCPNPSSGRGGGLGLASGRGRRCWNGGSTSTGLGCSGRRGRGHHSRGLVAEGRQGPESFYHRSMDENPWQQLEPILWKSRSLESPGSSNSWLPKSITTKKAKVSETFNQSSSQPSLAEYLAASFSEAANDTPNP